jgi:AmmeMemoRadiSam system protein B
MSAASVRPAVVAGLFYPDTPEAVAAEVSTLVPRTEGTRAIAAVIPHAGWKYSGALAGQLVGAIALPRRILIMAPNHTGRGERGAVWTQGSWKLPGLSVPVDEAFCQTLCDRSALLRPDEEAHEDEHAIEVLLPLLHARRPDLEIAPVVLGSLGWGECETLGRVLAEVVKEAEGETLILASSDMSHYLPERETREIDRKALEPMERLDGEGLYRVVKADHITMCGFVPATVALVAASALGAGTAQLVGYATSADAGGDRGRVVGYAALAIR